MLSVQCDVCFDDVHGMRCELQGVSFICLGCDLQSVECGTLFALQVLVAPTARTHRSDSSKLLERRETTSSLKTKVEMRGYT